MTLLEKLIGVIVCAAAILAVLMMMLAGFKLAMDAVREDARRAANLRAHRMADRLYREYIRGTRLHITQKITVVEDDLHGNGTAAERVPCDLCGLREIRIER